VILHQLPDERNVPCTNGAASVDKDRFHERVDTRFGRRT
jgi:hypothetical protein